MFKNNMIFFTAVFIGIGSNAFSGGYPNNSSDSSSSNLSSTQQNSSNLNAVNSSNMNYSNNNSTNNQQNVANNQQTQTFQRSSSSRGQSDQGFDAVENDELIIDTASIVDGDGMGSIQVQWQVSEDGDIWLVMPGAIQPSFIPRDSEVGKFLRVQISYVDGQGNTELLISPMSKKVQNVNDKPVGVPQLVGDAKERGSLTIDTSRITDEDGLGVMSLSWQRSSQRAKWENFTEHYGETLNLKQSDVGFSYRAVVSYIDGFGTRETLVTDPSETVANVDNPLEGEITIRGQAVEGTELVANTSSLVDYDGIASLSLTWEASMDGRTWEPIVSVGDKRKVNLIQELVGNMIRVRANVVDNFGVETVTYSIATEAVKNVNNRPSGNIFIRRISNN